MATTRLLHASPRPLDRLHPSSSSSSIRTVRCSLKVGAEGGKSASGESEKKPMVAAKASTAMSESVTVSEPLVDRGIDVNSLVSDVSNRAVFIMLRLKRAAEKRLSKSSVQGFVERVITDCRFFTLFAVAGSLLGSILCFVEGCFLVLESYFHYFSVLSQKSDEHMVHLLVESIDMFLLGTSMLIFGMGLYTMFVASRNIKKEAPLLPASNLFGLFHLKAPLSWIEMESVSEAKSKIGYAVMMILHVGMLEKFKSIPLVSCLDLACFAGSVFMSSAGLFLLSRLSPLRSTAV